MTEVVESMLTRYRPAEWDEVIGQDASVKSFRDAIEKKRGRAFLLVGPSGCGKTTLARIGAAKLGATKLTIHEADAAAESGKDDMKALIEQMSFRPLGGDVKAFIVDECHGLSKSAWNALLKSLEEPAPWVYWFLCTTEPAKVPETVRTRCLKYELKPVPVAVLRELLEVIAEAEGLQGKDLRPIIELCARSAQGSARQAIANLATCAAASSRSEAAELLQTAEEDPQAIELARLLVQGTSWTQVQKLLNGLSDKSPETVRHVVRAYATKVVLGARSESDAANGLAILEQFAEPFNPFDGMTPLVLACGRLLMAGDDR